MPKKALLVGINAYPQSPLNGCLNDVQDWFGALTGLGGFHADQIRAVTDQRATTQGIRAGLAWLAQGAIAGDEIFFAYSGHGSQVRATRGDELDDGLDEVICPVNLLDADYWDHGVITDDELGDWLASFPAGVRLTVALDSCHSGTATREFGPPSGNPHPTLNRYLPPPLDIQLRSSHLEHHKELKRRRLGRGARKSVRGLFDFLYPSRRQRQRKAVGTVVVPTMNHILLSGCRNDQTSADAFINNRYNGAFSYYALAELKKDPRRTLNDLHNAYVAAVKAGGYAQVPQLEGPQERISAPLFA